MRQVHYTVRSGLLKVIDFFYPPFRRVFSLQMFRYAACGGGNTLLGIVLYFVIHNYVFRKQVLDLGFYALKPHIATLFTTFILTFPIGFYLSMYVVFQGSFLRRRVQLIRYFLVALVCMLLNVALMKAFVDGLGWYPTPSYILTVVFVVAFSYVSQRYFSFRTRRNEAQVLENDG